METKKAKKQRVKRQPCPIASEKIALLTEAIFEKISDYLEKRGLAKNDSNIREHFGISRTTFYLYYRKANKTHLQAEDLIRFIMRFNIDVNAVLGVGVEAEAENP